MYLTTFQKKVDKKVDSTKIINLFKTGKTVAEIADKFGISKKCAQQIVSNNSSSSASAGPSIPMRRGVPVFTVCALFLHDVYTDGLHDIKLDTPSFKNTAAWILTEILPCC